MMVEKNNAPRFQIGELFRRFGPAFRETYPLWTEQRKAMKAIEQCRTPALDGHVEKCDCCGYERAFVHSCRNRHCPQCQYLARERWLAARKEDLLPIVYYHTVFTIPDEELNPLALVNKQVVYDILFRAGSETLMQLGRDPKQLGAEIGVTAILHTWAPTSWIIRISIALSPEADCPKTAKNGCCRKKPRKREIFLFMSTFSLTCSRKSLSPI